MEQKKPKIMFNVTLSKTFSYPKSVLERGGEKEDAIHKASFDIYKTLDEIINNKFEEVQVDKLFKFDCVEDKGFSFKITEKKSDTNVELEEVINHLALIDLEKEYGILNIEENPSLFVYDEGLLANDLEGNPQIIREDGWILRDTIEDKYQKLRGKYSKLLRTFNKPKLVTPSRRLNALSDSHRANPTTLSGSSGFTTRITIPTYNLESFINPSTRTTTVTTADGLTHTINLPR